MTVHSDVIFLCGVYYPCICAFDTLFFSVLNQVSQRNRAMHHMPLMCMAVIQPRFDFDSTAVRRHFD